jgi:Rhs element Vgr protein
MAAKSPLSQKTDLVSYSVMVDGSEVPGTLFVIGIEVKKEINKIPTATVVVLDGNRAESNFEHSSSDLFKPGKKLKISAGYHQQEEPIFEGLIVSHGIRINEDSLPELSIKCVDAAASMTVQKKNRYFTEAKDSDVITKVLGDHGGVSGSCDSTSFKHERVIQMDATDWDFMLTRADQNGLLVVVDDGKVKVKKPETSKDVLSLTFGTDIGSLELDVDARFQVEKVTVESWDLSTNEITKNESSEPSVPAIGNLKGKELAGVLSATDYHMHSAGPIDASDLKAWADAKMMRSRFSMLRGKIKFYGHAAPKPDTTVKLSGLGTRFTGSAYISGVYHRIKDMHWETELTIGLSPQMFSETQRDIQSPSSSGMLPGVNGVQIGVVQKIHEDPQGETRILVDVPVIAASGDAVWARQATYYATKEAGNFFMPEIGDEVLLAFINDDPRFPIIIGSVYSKKHMPAYTPDGPNTYKAITTNSKMKIEFEDVKRIITIWTPNGNMIEINDDKQSITILDETQNKMVMDPKGITWDTPKDFKLTATGKIEMKAQQTVSIEATQDLSIKGLNVKSEASVAISMKGATAEVNGSGQTTIKGGMVMIN